MFVKLGATIRAVINTRTFATGAAVNADSTPTVVIIEQGTALGYSPTVTNKATGLYEVQIDATGGNGFDDGKEYTAYAVTVIAGITERVPLPGYSAFTIGTREANVVAVDSGIQSSVFGVLELSQDGSQTPSRTQIAFTAPGSALDDYYNGRLVYVISGSAGAGGLAIIDDYTVLSKQCTLAGSGLPVAPGNDAVYAVFNAPNQQTSTAIRYLLDGTASIIVGSATLADILRLLAGVISGPVGDFRTGLLIFKSLDGSKTRATITTDASGRISVVLGDST